VAIFDRFVSGSAMQRERDRKREKEKERERERKRERELLCVMLQVTPTTGKFDSDLEGGGSNTQVTHK